MADDPIPQPVDTSHLTDADWAELNKLRQAWQTGGKKAMARAMKDLCDADPIRYLNVVAAYFPDMVRDVVKDHMAEIGLTEEDIRELVRKLQSPAGKQ